jgi:hypothetical protein
VKASLAAKADKETTGRLPEKQPRCSPSAKGPAERRSKAGQNEAPQSAVESEKDAEEEKRGHLVRARWIDELRQKGQKKQRHLRIEQVR